MFFICQNLEIALFQQSLVLSCREIEESETPKDNSKDQSLRAQLSIVDDEDNKIKNSEVRNYHPNLCCFTLKFILLD